jgi:isopentenyldiphosphate isomerase
VSRVDEAMLIDRVDQTDTVIGRIERGRVFDLKANFRVVHVFVLDRQGRLLLQRIPPGGKRHPGHWGSSVASYVFAGEGYEEAARRRLGQELGVTDAELQFFGKVPMDDAGCTKFIALFTARHDGPFRPDPGHIAALEFVPLLDIPGMHRRGERRFTPTFLLLLNFFTHQGLVHVP